MKANSKQWQIHRSNLRVYISIDLPAETCDRNMTLYSETIAASNSQLRFASLRWTVVTDTVMVPWWRCAMVAKGYPFRRHMADARVEAAQDPASLTGPKRQVSAARVSAKSDFPVAVCKPCEPRRRLTGGSIG